MVRLNLPSTNLGRKLNAIQWVYFKIVRERLDFRDVISQFGHRPVGRDDQVKILSP